MYRIVFLLASSCLIFNACTQKPEKIEELPYYNEADFSPIFLSSKQEYSTEITHQIADFSFINQDQQKLGHEELQGKIHVANFMFTSCGSICPSMTNNLKLVNNAFEQDNDVLLLSFSVTPWIDTPAKLKAYKERYEIDNPNWHFLTGNKAKIYELARQSYFAEDEIGFSKDSSDFLHTEHVLLIDCTKRIRGIYNGTLQLEMQQLIKDIQSLKKG